MSDSAPGMNAAVQGSGKPAKPTGVNSLREPVYRIIEPVTQWLVRNRVHPNAITVLGSP